MTTVSLTKMLKDMRVGFAGTGSADDNITDKEWKQISNGFQVMLDCTESDVIKVTNSLDTTKKARIQNHVNKELVSLFWSNFSPKFSGKYRQIWGASPAPKELIAFADNHFNKSNNKLNNIPKQLSFFAYQKEPTLSWGLTLQKITTMSHEIFPKFEVPKEEHASSAAKAYDITSYFVNMKIWQLMPKELLLQQQALGTLTEEFVLTGSKTLTDLVKALDLLPSPLSKARAVRELPSVSNPIFIPSCFSCGLKRHVGGDTCPNADAVCAQCTQNHPTSNCLRCKNCGHSHLFTEEKCDVTQTYVNQLLTERNNRFRTRQVCTGPEGIDNYDSFESEPPSPNQS